MVNPQECCQHRSRETSIICLTVTWQPPKQSTLHVAQTQKPVAHQLMSMYMSVLVHSKKNRGSNLKGQGRNSPAGTWGNSPKSAAIFYRGSSTAAGLCLSPGASCDSGAGKQALLLQRVASQYHYIDNSIPPSRTQDEDLKTFSDRSLVRSPLLLFSI